MIQPEILRIVKMDITSQLSKEHTASIKKTCSDYLTGYGIFATEICRHKTANYNNVYRFAYDDVKYTVTYLQTPIASTCGRNACANVKTFNANETNTKKQKKYNSNLLRHPKRYETPAISSRCTDLKFYRQHSRKSVILNTSAISLFQNGTIISFHPDDMHIRIPINCPNGSRINTYKNWIPVN